MAIGTVLRTFGQHGFKGTRLLFKYVAARNEADKPGNAVECPVCGWTGTRFWPYMIMPIWMREDAQCPHCQALERHRFHYLFYKEQLEKEKRPLKVLHFAPEDALKSLFQQDGMEYTECWYESPTRGNMEAIEYEDNSFDWIISHHVLEHVEDDVKALKEVHRVLKPGGVKYLSVPLTWGQPTEEYGFADPNENDHWRHYGDNIFDKFGELKAERIDANDKHTPEEIQRYGLIADETLFALRKEA